MRGTDEIILGLTLIRAYDPKLSVGAEHDEIFAWCDGDTVPVADKEWLEDIGWRADFDNIGGFRKFV